MVWWKISYKGLLALEVPGLFFHEELERIQKFLQKNTFPKFFIDQIVSSFMTKQVNEGKNSDVASNEAAEEIR